jgi:hypothetical protein
MFSAFTLIPSFLHQKYTLIPCPFHITIKKHSLRSALHGYMLCYEMAICLPVLPSSRWSFGNSIVKIPSSTLAAIFASSTLSGNKQEFLTDKGFQYWFDLDEIDALEQHNENFRAQENEEQ